MKYHRLPENPPKIRKGQYWKNKHNGLLLEITGTQNEMYKTRNCYGSPKSHTVSRRTLLINFDLVTT